MGVLATGGVAASRRRDARMSVNRLAGLALAVFAFLAIGIGVGAAGTSPLLVLLVVDARAPRSGGDHRVDHDDRRLRDHRRHRRSQSRSVLPSRLVAVMSTASVLALLLAIVAVWGVRSGREGRGVALRQTPCPRAAVRRRDPYGLG